MSPALCALVILGFFDGSIAAPAGEFFKTPMTAELNPRSVNDPAKCAADLTAAVAAITSGSNTIVKSVANCPPKTAAGSGKDSTCAANILSVTASFAKTSEKLASASKSCANTLATQKGADCGEKISAAIKMLSGSSVCLISTTESCKVPEEGGSPFACVVDVVDVVDSLAGAALKINQAVDKCSAARTANPDHSYLYNTWMATGCTVLPSPAWIHWGYWYESTPQKVWTEMFDWCLNAKTGGHLHAARMCCGDHDGKCEQVQCDVQSQYAGPKPLSLPGYKPSRTDRNFPQDLE